MDSIKLATTIATAVHMMHQSHYNTVQDAYMHEVRIIFIILKIKENFMTGLRKIQIYIPKLECMLILDTQSFNSCYLTFGFIFPKQSFDLT